MMRKWLMATTVGVFVPTLAFGQTAGVPEGVGVADRPRPEYQPIGGRLGSFFLYPEFAITADATDNVRATSTARLDDVYFTVHGKAKVRSNFSRHAFNLQFYADHTLHANVTSEDAKRFGAQFDGVYDISRDTQISALLVADRGLEPRSSFTSPVGARDPSRFDRVNTALTVRHKFENFDLSGTFAFRTIGYNSVALLSGGGLDQSYRDANVYSGSLALGYEFRPKVSVVLRANVDKVNYRLSPTDPRQPLGLDRDSKGIQIVGGFRFELTRLLYGEVHAGYYKRNYADPLLRDSAGIAFGGDVLWNVTTLTSLRVGADRRIDEASSTNIAGNRTTEVQVSVDHELKRNLILSADARQAWIQPLGPEASSRQFQAGAGARLLMSRQLSVRGGYRYAKRTSPVAGRAFREKLGSISALLTF